MISADWKRFPIRRIYPFFLTCVNEKRFFQATFTFSPRRALRIIATRANRKRFFKQRLRSPLGAFSKASRSAPMENGFFQAAFAFSPRRAFKSIAIRADGKRFFQAAFTFSPRRALSETPRLSPCRAAHTPARLRFSLRPARFPRTSRRPRRLSDK